MSLDKIQVASIGGKPVTLADVFRTMRASGSFDALRRGLADTIAHHKAIEMGLGVSNEDLQHAADAFREANGLLKAEDTLAWLNSEGHTIEDFEQALEFNMLQERLRNHVASEQKITRRFQSEGAAFNAAELSQIVLFDRDEAVLVQRTIASGAMEFFDAAREYSEDFETRGAGGYVGWRSRNALPQDLADTILSAEPGDLIGPVEVGDVFAIIRVLAIRAPKLDQASRTQLRETIFREWMDEQLRETSADLEFMPDG